MNITDTDRINWIEEGHCVMCLSSKEGTSKDTPRFIFTADFENQEWGEFPTAREAIDFVIKKSLS